MSNPPDQAEVLLPSSELLDPTVLRTGSPIETALIRILDLAETHGLDPSVLLRKMSQDFVDAESFRLQCLAGELESGVPLRDALLKYPDLISIENALAIRLASGTDSLQTVYREILSSSEFSGESWSWQSLGSNVFGSVARVLFLLWLISGLMLFVIPTFEELFDEFELRLPAPTLFLISISDAAARILPNILAILLLPSIIFVLFRFVRWSRLINDRGINIMAWRKAWIPERTRLLPLLAVAADSGNLRRGLETLSEDHPNAKIRNRFLWTLQRIDQGDAPVAAMKKGGLLSKREASSLAFASSGSTQAWLFRWFAARRQSRRFLWSGMIQRVFSVMTMAFVLLLLAIASIGVFMPLFSLITSLTS